MVKNKKGFLRILEAIVAIILVLGFVIAIIPGKTKNTSKLPPDLEQTTSSILKEIQNRPEFRQCIANGSIDYNIIKNLIDSQGNKPKSITDAECVKYYINYISFPVSTNPWDYAVKICKISSTAIILDCNYYPKQDGKDWIEKNRLFVSKVVPYDRDVYTKDLTITVPDVKSSDQKNNNPGNYSLLTIYAWSKQ